MSDSEKPSIPAKVQLRLAMLASEAYLEIDSNTRPGRKADRNDQRYSKEVAKNRREAIGLFIGNIRPGLVCLAYELAYDPKLKDQITGTAEPIKFHKADDELALDDYADMLALAARATGRNTQGRFGAIVLNSNPQSTAEDVAFQFRYVQAHGDSNIPD